MYSASDDPTSCRATTSAPTVNRPWRYTPFSPTSRLLSVASALSRSPETSVRVVAPLTIRS